MNINVIDATYIERLLKDAAAAHHEYEAKLGKPHDDWAGWYAAHMVAAMQADKAKYASPGAHAEMLAMLAARGNPGVARRLTAAQLANRKHSDTYQP